MSDGIGSVSVTVVPDARGFPEKLRAQLDATLRNLKATINVDADTAKADGELETTNAMVDRLDGRTANIKVDVDKSSFSRAESAIGSITSKLSGLGLAAGALGPGLIPIGAGVAGLGAALGGPLSAAAGGMAAFAAAATVMVTQAEKAAKAGDALTPLQSKLINLGHTLSTAWAGVEKQIGPAVLGVLTNGLQLLTKLLPLAVPLLKSVSTALDGLISSASKVVDTKGFQSLVAFFSKEAGTSIGLFGKALGNIALGIGQFFKAMTPEGNRLLQGFVDLTGKFAHADFTNIAKSLSTAIGPTLTLVGNLFKIVSGTVTSLAGYGSKVLGVLDKITGALAKVPQLGGALGVGLGASFLGGPEAGLAAGGVVALVGAFQKLYDSSKPLRNIIHDIGDYFTSTWLPKIQQAAQDVMPALSSAFKDISKTIRQNKGFLTTLGEAFVALGSASVVAGIESIAAAIRIIAKVFGAAVTQAHLFADVTLVMASTAARAFQMLLRVVTSTFGTILHEAATAFGWVPGLGGKLKAADAAFHSFAANAVNSVGGVADKLDALRAKIDAVGNSHPSFKVVAQTQQAISALERIQAMRIADKQFTITETQVTRQVGPGGGMGRHASGGYISGPGGPRDDVIPAWLSNGEFVVNAAATALYRPFLESINARKFAGGGMVGAPNGSGAAQSLSNLSNAANAATTHLQALTQAQTALAQAVTSSLRSSLFGASSSPFAGGASLDGILSGDISKARGFSKALHTLARHGLDKRLLAELAQSGDLQSAQMLAGEGHRQIALDNRLYRERQRLTAGIGRYAANQVYGEQRHAELDELRHIRAEIKHLRAEQKQNAHRTGQAVGQAVNHSAQTAQRRHHG